MNHDSVLTQHVFQVQCTTAQHVSLVIGAVDQAEARIVPLRSCGEGMWRTALPLFPGTYRYCYHAYDGRALMYVAPPAAPLDELRALLHVGPANTANARHFEPASANRY